MSFRVVPVLLVALSAGRVSGQEPALAEPPRVPISYSELMTRDVAVYDPARSSTTPRLRMFNMPTGFLAAPIGIQDDDDPPADGSAAKGGDDALSFMQFNVGMYNPNFDLHLPGDPGGLGYYKLYSQMQLLDQGSTSVCLDLQAYTPAGIQMRGVANGPTVALPAISWFQELGAGTALQGYVGQQIQANSAWRDNLHSGFNYGMALQYPLPKLSPQPNQSVYFFVQALGRYRYDGATINGQQAFWEVLPGLQWRLGESSWFSFGVSHYNFLRWSWQF